MEKKNRTALVTGGSRGIGAAVVRRLAEDGYQVAFTYLRSKEAADRMVTELSGRGMAFQADAASVEDMSGLVDRVVEAYGGLDVLVNNAGVFSNVPLGDATDEEFERVVNINIRAVFLASRAAARVMGSGGRIIIIGSVNGDRIPFDGVALYGMSKAAVAALAKGWARDLGPRGITVNCVQPGPIDTDLNPADGDFAEALKPITALNRYGKTEEVASLVSFLAGPESGYITGASLNIDGGFNA